jgi:NADPH:quinone reductase-like Zn-dependent oxidoreductase
VHELDAMPVPASLSLAEAAGVPEAWLTAFQLLHTVGGAAPGQRLLLHAAGSGVGTAALQLAVAHGLRVAAVAGAPRKLALAAELGAEVALNRKEVWRRTAAGVAAGANNNSGGGGGGGNSGGPGALARALAPSFALERGGHVDLVLDCVGGGDVYAAAHAEVLATDGVWVLFGLLGGAAPGPPGHALFGALMRKRLQLRATTLRSRSAAYKRALQRRLAEEVLPFFRGSLPHPLGVTGAEEVNWLEGGAEEREAAFRAACPGGVRPRGATPCFRARLDRVFPLREAQAAHARMLANGNLGKIVLGAMHEGRPGLSCACEAVAVAGGEGQQQQQQQQPAPEAGEEGGGGGALGDVNNAVFD